MGERVCAVIVARNNAEVSEGDIIEWCHERLASFKKPETVIFAESLPRNALGKLMRPELRERLRAQALNGEVDGK